MSMMDNKILVTFTVNGRQVEVLTAPNRTLLEVLRGGSWSYRYKTGL